MHVFVHRCAHIKCVQCEMDFQLGRNQWRTISWRFFVLSRHLIDLGMCVSLKMSVAFSSKVTFRTDRTISYRELTHCVRRVNMFAIAFKSLNRQPQLKWNDSKRIEIKPNIRRMLQSCSSQKIRQCKIKMLSRGCADIISVLRHVYNLFLRLQTESSYLSFCRFAVLPFCRSSYTRME